MYLAKNTSQSASVEFVRFQRTNYARGRLQAFCPKRALPFGDSLKNEPRRGAFLRLRTYSELKKELAYSKTTRADEISELIKEARGFGDLSENSEYDEAKNEQGKLYSRIAELEEILLHAVIVDESEMDSDKISIGCRVVVTNLDNGKQLPEYTIVGSQEANVMERKVSEDSPFGKALMGTKAGDEITVEAPRGVIRYRVDSIER